MTTGPRRWRRGDHVERTRIETIGERILQQKQRDLEQARIARLLEAVALQRAEIVGKPRVEEELLEDFPVPPLAFGPHRLAKLAAKIGDDHAVVEQCVVDVDEKRDVDRLNAH